MKRAINDILKSLSRRDVEALRSIYMFRCLTRNQLYQLHYKKSLMSDECMSDEWVNRKIQELLNLNLIEPAERITKFKDEDPIVYFLTPLGIEVIRYCFDLPTNIYDVKKQVAKRGYYRASELKIYPKNINHQVHLNQFVIDFMDKHAGLSWKYYDEKYVSQFVNIRPDGMITMLDTDFFLEMDMATESKKQLQSKWENYRNFLNSREYAYKERKIVVLFIADNTERTKERIDLIKYTAYERLIDIIDADFEMYFGTPSQLQELLTNQLIPSLKGQLERTNEISKSLSQSHGFNVSSAYPLKSALRGTEHKLYLRKVNDQNRIVAENYRLQEYVLDDYTYAPLSVLSKIAYFEQRNLFFKEQYNREISYIVLVESEEQIHHDLKLVDMIGVKNVFFTTLQRLQTMPFHQALFHFDFLGNIYQFGNSGLEERIFERAIEA